MNFVSEKAKIGNNVQIGMFTIVEEDVIIGDNVIIEHHCVIKKNVIIGANTRVKNYVELRENTTVGESCTIDSRVSSSGNCKIGNNVTLRYDTIIARGVEIGDNTYVCPRVMTNNLNTSHAQIGGAKIGANCFIGTNAVLQHGITLGDNVTIGSMAFVNKDCEANATYIGIPATKKPKITMSIAISQIAETFGLTIVGKSTLVDALGGLNNAHESALYWSKNAENLAKMQTGVVICNHQDYEKISPVSGVLLFALRQSKIDFLQT